MLALIAKPDEARKSLLKQWPDDFEGDLRLDSEAFMERFLGPVHNSLSDWSKDYGIQPFYIGKLSNHKIPEERILMQESYEDCGAIFEWIYLHFTGVRLGPTFGQRVKEFVVNLFN